MTLLSALSQCICLNVLRLEAFLTLVGNPSSFLTAKCFRISVFSCCCCSVSKVLGVPRLLSSCKNANAERAGRPAVRARNSWKTPCRLESQFRIHRKYWLRRMRWTTDSAYLESSQQTPQQFRPADPVTLRLLPFGLDWSYDGQDQINQIWVSLNFNRQNQISQDI